MGGEGHALDVVSVSNSTPLKCAFRTNETRRCGVRALHAGVQVGAVQIIQADLQTFAPEMQELAPAPAVQQDHRD